MPSACSSVMTLKAAAPPPRTRASRISSAVVTSDMVLLLNRCGVDAFPTIRNHIHGTPIMAMCRSVMAAFAGLDVGTTSSKAVVYGEDGAELGTGRATTTWNVGPQGTQTAAETLRPSA